VSGLAHAGTIEEIYVGCVELKMAQLKAQSSYPMMHAQGRSLQAFEDKHVVSVSDACLRGHRLTVAVALFFSSLLSVFCLGHVGLSHFDFKG